MVQNWISTFHWQGSPTTTVTKRASRCHLSKHFMNDFVVHHWAGLSRVKELSLTPILWQWQKRRWSRFVPTYWLPNLVRRVTLTRDATLWNLKLVITYGPYPIIDKYGLLSYQLQLPSKLSGVHNVFHVSQLKRSLKPLTDVVIEDTEGPEKATRGGVNGSQSKFLEETWSISQIKPDTLLF
jgi:hypothetical protein